MWGFNLETDTDSYWSPLLPVLLLLTLLSVAVQVALLLLAAALLQDTGTTRSKSANVPRSTASVASPSHFSVIIPGKRSYTRRNRWHRSSLQKTYVTSLGINEIIRLVSITYMYDCMYVFMYVSRYVYV